MWSSQLTYAELGAQLGYMNGIGAGHSKSWVDEETVDPVWDRYYRVLRLVHKHREKRVFGESS